MLFSRILSYLGTSFIHNQKRNINQLDRIYKVKVRVPGYITIYR